MPPIAAASTSVSAESPAPTWRSNSLRRTCQESANAPATTTPQLWISSGPSSNRIGLIRSSLAGGRGALDFAPVLSTVVDEPSPVRDAGSPRARLRGPGAGVRQRVDSARGGEAPDVGEQGG